MVGVSVFPRPLGNAFLLHILFSITRCRLPESQKANSLNLITPVLSRPRCIGQDHIHIAAIGPGLPVRVRPCPVPSGIPRSAKHSRPC